MTTGRRSPIDKFALAANSVRLTRGLGFASLDRVRFNVGIGMGIGGFLVVVGTILWSFELQLVARFGPGHWHEAAIASLLLGAACLALGAYQKSLSSKEGD